MIEPRLPPDANPLDLDRLPALSVWPSVLLGLRGMQAKRRDRQQVLREYDTEKWGRALSLLQLHGGLPTQDDILRAAGADPARLIAFSHRGRLYSAEYGAVLQAYLNWMVECLRPLGPHVLVELGSGLGDKLLWIQRALGVPSVYGGEFTPSGVAAGRLLAERKAQAATFASFDFTDPETLAFVPEGAVVYTSHAIEQVPELPGTFIDALAARRPRTVLHFEPCYEAWADESLMGLMTRRYAQLNDYNTNLKSLLASRQDQGGLEMVELRHDVFGINPLNPTTLYMWRPLG